MKELKLLINILKKNFFNIWKIFLVIIFLSLLANLFTIAQPLIFASMLEVVIPENLNIFENQGNIKIEKNNFFDLNFIGNSINEFIKNNLLVEEISNFKSLIYLSSLFLFFVLLASLFNYFGVILTKWSNFTFTISLRDSFIKHLLSLDYIFFLKSKYSELVSRAFSDAKNVGQGIVPLLQAFFHNITLVIIYSLFLFSTNYILYFACFFIFMTQYIITIIIKKPIQDALINVNNKTAKLLSKLNEIFSSIKIIQLLKNENFFYEQANKLQKEERKAGFKASIFDEIQTPITTVLTSISIIVILFTILFQIKNGEMTLQGGALFLIMGRLIVNPIVRLSVIFTWLVSFGASYYKINHYQSIKPNILDGTFEKKSFDKEIEFKNAKFAYDKSKEITLGDLSIKRFEKIALVGQSGSGKSTFADILLRLHDLVEGNILIDGEDIKKYKIKDYRSLFGFIPQDPILFHDSILENIRCGRKHISDDKILKAAKIANVDKFVQQKPNKYNTIIGDRGAALSGGERQRISIARAIVSEPEILLLDEATSSLDIKNETELLNELEIIFKNKTVIIISHKYTFLSKVDKIILFENGKINKIGTHQELLSKSNLYKELIKLHSI